MLIPYSKVTPLYIHICVCILFPTIFNYGLTQDIERSSLGYSRSLFIHPVYDRLHLLSPDSRCIPLPSLLSNHQPVFVSVSLFLFCRWVHLCHIVDSTYK